MFRFFETIKIVDGEIKHLDFHQKRVDETIISNYKENSNIILKNLINIPYEFRFGIVKCRFDYNSNSFCSHFTKYIIKPINSLKLVKNDCIDYSFKHTDRSKIDKLLELKEDCDDIIIVRKNKITDTSISNLIFFDGKKWITPDSPLLNGTCRQRLIKQGRIETKPVFMEDLYNYKAVSLINSMRGDNLENTIDISAIK